MKRNNKRAEQKQFTSRIDVRIMRFIERESQRTGESKNDVLNEILELGVIALANKRKAAATNNGPSAST